MNYPWVTDRPIPPSPPQKNAVELAAARRDERKQKYDQAWALHEQGYSGKAIANQLGVGTTSVFRYLRTSTFPERKGRSDKGCCSVSPYKKYFLAQWNCGCHDTKKLYREIQVLGYEGSYCTVARYTCLLREAQGFKPGRNRLKVCQKFLNQKNLSRAVRRAVWLVLRRPSEQSEKEKQALSLLKQQHPHLQTAIELTEKFANLVLGQQPDRLDEWIQSAEQSQIKAVIGFATKLKDDLS